MLRTHKTGFRVDLRGQGLESYRIVSQEINLESMVAVFIEALTETRPM